MSNDLPTDSTDACEPSVDSFLRAVASETYEQRQLAMLDAEAALARRLVPGALIADRYRLERLLRAGGMGIVWAAVHAITGRHVALKFLKTSWALDERSRRRFLQEARAATAVRHPNVVEVFDVLDVDGETRETPLIVMELLAGETLGDRLARDGRLSVELTASLLAPVVSAVGTAHSCGIVHRDLKPDNIFLLRDGAASVKVLDFGIAKLTGAARLSDDTAIATGSGATLGTPRYMAPEQLCADTDLDHRADIWALGAILYECLSGQRAVKGTNLAQAALQLAGPGVVPIVRVAPHVPRALAELVDRMLASDRKARPASLHEVRDALARCGRVQTPSFDRPAVAGSSDELEVVPSSRRRFLGSPRRALAAVSCALALAAALAYQLLSGAAEAAPRTPPRTAPIETVTPLHANVVSAPLLLTPAESPRGVEQLDTSRSPSLEPPPRQVRVATRPVRAKKKPAPAPVRQPIPEPVPAPFRGGVVERVPF